MTNEKFGDWRIAFVTTLAQDVPAAYPGGPSHRAGTPVYQSSVTKHPEHNTLGFITPSPVALALNLAFKGAQKAKKLQSALALENVATPQGSGKSVAKPNLPLLYDFFEMCMSTVVFSFQAVEVYSNHTISSYAKGPITVKRKDRWHEMTAEEVERQVSTVEKVSDILPKLLSVPTPKGKKPWEGFKKLKVARDSTIHLKSNDMSTKGFEDNDSLFFQFLNNDPTLFPKAAFEIIDYFLVKEGEPRWARIFKNKNLMPE